MKGVLYLLVFLSAKCVYAQGVFSNQTNVALQKVIEDYPNKFKSIKGDQLSNSSETTNYSSKVEIKGATNCTITRYNRKKDSYSWQCELVESSSFDDMKTKFKECFDHIKNTIIKIDGQQPFILNGRFENPTTEREMTSVLFDLLPNTGDMQRLKVELRLQHRQQKWAIILSVYEREQGDYAKSNVSDE